MTILLTGANGQVGWEVKRRCKKRGYNIRPYAHSELDITNPISVEKAINQTDISMVVNAAAYTNVDKAELEPDLAFAVNRDGPAYIASYCKKAGIPLIHISSDYVFDGEKREPYLETDAVNPINVYGRTKEAGESEVRNILREHIILRTSWVYGIQGSNFVKTMIRLGCEKEILRVVDDQFGCPTSAEDISKTILSVIHSIQQKNQIFWGTYHFCSHGVTTWHFFAKTIFHMVKSYTPLVVKKVIPITTQEYATPAKRPYYSVLDTFLIQKHYGITPKPWSESLASVIHAIFLKENNMF